MKHRKTTGLGPLCSAMAALLASCIVLSTTNHALGQSAGVYTSVASGYEHTCALTAGGSVKCWGRNNVGQLGDNSNVDSLAPRDVVGAADVVSIDSRFRHTCVLTPGGAVKCWGDNEYGQIGDGTATNAIRATDVDRLGSGIVAISVGGRHTCALTSEGGVKCWGTNAAGQIGDGTLVSKPSSTDVIGLTRPIIAASCGYDHTCAVTVDGAVKCWGNNTSGQIGANSLAERFSSPTDVFGLTSGIVAIGSGIDHTCAISTAGGMKCWGNNVSTQIGDGTTINRLAPVDVIGLDSDATAVVAGQQHTCALLTNGRIQCRGDNASGTARGTF